MTATTVTVIKNHLQCKEKQKVLKSIPWPTQSPDLIMRCTVQ